MENSIKILVEFEPYDEETAEDFVEFLKSRIEPIKNEFRTTVVPDSK